MRRRHLLCQRCVDYWFGAHLTDQRWAQNPQRNRCCRCGGQARIVLAVVSDAAELRHCTHA